jgi:hypothetical protein
LYRMSRVSRSCRMHGSECRLIAAFFANVGPAPINRRLQQLAMHRVDWLWRLRKELGDVLSGQMS